MDKKNILILLGGYWHDFDGFAAAMTPLLEGAGHRVRASYDFEDLTRLEAQGIDLLLSHTCLSEPPAGKTPSCPAGFSSAQVTALSEWVRRGGALLASHAATVPGESGPELERLLGGAFLRHPPQRAFQVLPLSAPHPITDGIGAFKVFDELYIERYHPTVAIHMVAAYEGTAHPVVWSRTEGRGRVAHLAPGHSERVWKLEPYRRLMLQTVRWLLER